MTEGKKKTLKKTTAKKTPVTKTRVRKPNGGYEYW
jgi:hypothetical protein